MILNMSSKQHVKLDDYMHLNDDNRLQQFIRFLVKYVNAEWYV